MKKMSLKRMFAVAISGSLALFLLAGCGTSQPSETVQSTAESKVVGTVLLSVNPEIAVEYDDGGLVLGIKGINDDGKSIVRGYDEYKGKDCRTVVNELVRDIYEAGYFDETVDGHTKNIVLKLEEGSAYPGDKFLEEVAGGAREAVKTCGIGSSAMTVQENDLDNQGYIGEEKAKELVLAQLGITSASFNEHEYELDDGVYEFEFSANDVWYEYEVDARTGKILEADLEGNDDWKAFDNAWDDKDDQYDDHDDKDDRYDDHDDKDDQYDDRDDKDDQYDDRDDKDDQYDDRDDQYDDRDDQYDDRDDKDDQYDDRDDKDDQYDDHDDKDDRYDDRDDKDDQYDDRDDKDDQYDDRDDRDDDKDDQYDDYDDDNDEDRDDD